MRKRTDYVEDSFSANCADIRITIKPLLITRKKVSRAVRKNLRNTCKEFILDYIKEKDYVQICSDILEQTMQKAMLPKLKKIYPLSFCDIRTIDTKEIEKVDLQKASQENQEEFNEESQDETVEETIEVKEEDKTDSEETKKEVVENEEDNSKETEEVATEDKKE